MSGKSVVLLGALVAGLVAATGPDAAAMMRFVPSERVKTGTVWETNPARTRILLTDGTVLVVPPSLNLPPFLVPSASIKAYYEEREGQKVVTLLALVPPTYP